MEATTHDAARYIFDQAHYALSTHDEWSAAPGQPPSAPKHYSDPTTTTSSATRLTRNRAAALAKQNQSSNEQQQPAFQNYSPSRYLNDAPPIPLDGDQTGPYATSPPLPPNVYSYSSSFSPDVPASPGASPTTANGPSHPPPPPHPASGVVHPASLAAVYSYPPPPPGMMMPGRPDSFGVDDIQPPPNMYGTSNVGTELMRVPSASPSVASGSPPPDDYTPGAAYQIPSSRGSSANYNGAGGGPGSGPISPLSSSFAPQPLPSTFSAATGGYLHGPPQPPSQQQQVSQQPLVEGDTELSLAPADSAGRGAGNRSNQKTKTKLTDMDRKFICVFAQNHPKARQEDIATKFAVERSTVSKILKCKEKWMKVDFFSSEARVVKHRPSKFPELEAALIHHIRMRIATREPVNDSFIKKTALELANARGIGKDKFKASSGWVENFKHRHDLRKGGLWDKSGNPASSASSWAAAAAAAKYSQGDANGSQDADAEEDYSNDPPFGVVGQVNGGYHHGAEESNPLDEAAKTTSGVPMHALAYQQDMGPRTTTTYPPPFIPTTGGMNMYASQPKIAGVDGSPPEAESPTAKQGPNPDFYPVDTAPFGGIPPYPFYPGSMHHLTTPRSASVTSRSTSSASGPSIGGSPASVQSSVLPGGRHGSPSSVSPPSSGSRRYSGLPPPSSVGAHMRGHGHRRSTSGSYTSSPLAVEVGGGGEGSPAGSGSSLALHGVPPHPYITPSRPSRRSVTFSSFSAMMAAGLSLDNSNDGGRVQTTRKDNAASRYGHSRSISQGSSGLGQAALTGSPQQHEEVVFGSPQTVPNP